MPEEKQTPETIDAANKQLVDELLQSFVERYRPIEGDEMADEIITPVSIAEEIKKYAFCTPQQVLIYMTEAGWKLDLQHDNKFAYMLMRRNGL